MLKLAKYFHKLANSFDISPVEPGGITKLMVYVLWGINALVFLGKDINLAPEHFSPGIYSYKVNCTELKKVASTDLYIEGFSLIKVSPIVVILPYDYELPILDVITLPRDRSPPYELFS